MAILMWLGLSILSGILGRMGGSNKYDTKWRDVGCSIMVLLTLWLLKGFNLGFWWVYLLIFGLHWVSYSTYWDWLFGYDNLWFSGFAVGLSVMPLLWCNIALWVIIGQAILLAIIWGGLNKIKYDRILLWRRDVVEEFLRYAIRILILAILLI